MVVCLFFEKTINLKKVKENYYKKEFLIGQNERFYFDDALSNGFELGFYNWLIEDEKLLGVNFKIHESNKEIIINFLSNNNFPQVNLNEEEVNVFFISNNKKTDFWVDYSECFTDFFLLRSDKGNIAITFEIPDDLEYELPLLPLECF